MEQHTVSTGVESKSPETGDNLPENPKPRDNSFVYSVSKIYQISPNSFITLPSNLMPTLSIQELHHPHSNVIPTQVKRRHLQHADGIELSALDKIANPLCQVPTQTFRDYTNTNPDNLTEKQLDYIKQNRRRKQNRFNTQQFRKRQLLKTAQAKPPFAIKQSHLEYDMHDIIECVPGQFADLHLLASVAVNSRKLALP